MSFVREALPPLPTILLEETADQSPYEADGFLRLRRKLMVARYPDGSVSAPFVYDSVMRRALDAVVIVPFRRELRGEHEQPQLTVFLRSSVRPPLLDASQHAEPGSAALSGAALWELPAGLIEPEEAGSDGARAAAQRELLEELGFDVPADRFFPLGFSCFPAPAVIGERHYFYAVDVGEFPQREPTLDGSPLEVGAAFASLRLEDALARCATGELRDEKTELALHRLRAWAAASTGRAAAARSS